MITDNGNAPSDLTSSARYLLIVLYSEYEDLSSSSGNRVALPLKVLSKWSLRFTG